VQQQETDMNGIKIITVEDDPHLLETLVDQLKNEGFKTYGCACIAEAKPVIKDIQPDLILLDVTLSDGDGRDMCRWIRNEGHTIPILMLTGQDSEMDTIDGLEAGANDYITKPLRMADLLTRIHMHIKLYQNREDAKIPIGNFYFVQGRKTLIHKDNKCPLSLTEKETEIIKYLLKKKGNGAGKNELLEEVWGYNTNIKTHTLETHIYRLRQKINDIDDAPFLVTKDDGYMLAE
jgi:DNA-binding response OmpR family regulator